MICSEVRDSGLQSARSRLKKTPVTTILRSDGRRFAITRGEDGTETEELIEEKRSEDQLYLTFSCESNATATKDAAVTAAPPRCDEELLDASECPRFAVDDAVGFLAHLEEHGYVVVKEVASAAERGAAEDLLWQFLMDSTGFERSAPSTWTDEQFERIGCSATGIISRSGIGQSEFMWYLRLLPRVRQAFASIWGTSDLLTSFDGANVFRPWRQEEFGFSRTLGGWYHVDQGKGLPGLESVQGFVSLLDADASTGGFVVIPRSHWRHDELTRYQHTVGINYISVPSYHPIMEMRKKLVVCRAGDLVLWDSRCVHCNAPGRVLQPESNVSRPPQLLRIAAYICMTPKSKASTDVLEQRRAAYRNRITTSHWPHLFTATRADRAIALEMSQDPLDLEAPLADARRSLIA